MKGDEVKLDVRFCDGELKVSAASLFDALSLEDKLELARRISVEEDVVVSVVDQLLNGWTEAGDSASSTVLDAQRRRLLDAIGDEVLKRVVIHALREVESAKKAEERADKEKSNVLRLVCDFVRDCDQELGCRAIAHKLWGCHPAWEMSKPVTDRDAVAFIEKVAGEIEVVRRAKQKERDEEELLREWYGPVPPPKEAL